ncbi:BTAD domain-containing putative transcriptional regulator [Streptomyces sp. WI04-05B]|uniref:BTAD domain-containing putative transcriptional regulator n=1 Tax=Streptomyces TaxID=1883 RepID=UPI0029AB9B6B|nr:MULTISPECIES: BTAD domain-containing putative transcriptional regulator [unclassified Streptomyces]MDX2546773.1 BTAD domain-containing putative transcriptional regulator [Streptomyces sp. WI04-05B]MDX2589569.1 BTAD domain-containing putative transcriptional regulator [Streptomyces sp. WI04-05A]
MPEQLGPWLRGRRAQLGLSQPQLAELAGVSTRTIREIERGRARSPHSPSVLRLMAVLGPDSAPEPVDERQLRLDVLGPLLFQVAGRPAEPGSAKQSALLALLGLHPGTAVSQDEIVDTLWDGRPPVSSANMVHTYVARLRRLLTPATHPEDPPGGVLRRTRTGYVMDLDEQDSDAARFTGLASRALPSLTDDGGEPTDRAEAYAQAEEALRLWRGPVLQGMPPGLREHPSAVGLTRLRLSLVQAYADSALAAGTQENAVHELRRTADLEPLHEGLHARLMLALAASGEQAAALSLYTALRDRLDDQLGVRPGPEVTDAHLRVLHMDVPRAATSRPTATPAPAAPPVAPALLPYDSAFFTGRDDHLALLDALLPAGKGPAGGTGVCALTGAGGAGKTALAVHWAHRVRDRFPDGQLFVDLRGHSPEGPVRPVEALTRFLLALGVAAEAIPGTPETAADLYRTLAAERRMLVVLDNAADAEQVRPLLPGGPGCLVLVTSRDRLAGLAARDGARRIGVDVLSPAESRLLLHRTLGAARVDADPRAAAELAHACGHLPLALRIAAANLDHTPWRTLEEQAAELRDGDRLTALSVTGDETTAVRGAFDLSYHALDAPARRMFRLLALVPGPETGLDAAAVAAGLAPEEAAPLLERLTAAHLLREDRAGRYRRHDLVALYAAERLRLEETAEDRHAASDALYTWLLNATGHCAQLLYPGQAPLPPTGTSGPDGSAHGDGDGDGGRGNAVPPPRIPDAAAAIRWLDDELPNLAAAVQQAAAECHPASWQLAYTLVGHSWTRKNAMDWAALGRAALDAARAADEPVAQAAMHNLLGAADLHQSLPYAAIPHFEQTLALAEAGGWLEGTAVALTNLASVNWLVGRLTRGAEYLERATEIDRRNGMPDGHPVVLLTLGITLRDLGRLTESLDRLRQAERAPRNLDSLHNRILTHANLGRTLYLLGDPARAAHHLTTALTMVRESGEQGSEAYVLRFQSSVHRDAGDLTTAVDMATTATRLFDQDGEEYYRADARIALGSVLLTLGSPGEADVVYREALKLAEERGADELRARALLGLAAMTDPPDREQISRALDIARGTDHLMVQGEALTALARAELLHGEAATAAARAHEALAVHRGTGWRRALAESLDILGRALATTGEEDPAPYRKEAQDIFRALGMTSHQD